MTDPRDDVPPDDLAEQERDLAEAPDPDDTLPDAAVRGSAEDADEGDRLEQSMPVGDAEDDGYPYGTSEE